MSNINQSTVEEKEEKSDRFWQPIIGIGLIVFGFYLFSQFTKFENSDGSMRIHWFFAMLYNIGGKWLACAAIWLIGAGLTFFGIKNLIKKKAD